jgi:hypothetical protein
MGDLEAGVGMVRVEGVRGRGSEMEGVKMGIEISNITNRQVTGFSNTKCWILSETSSLVSKGRERLKEHEEEE